MDTDKNKKEMVRSNSASAFSRSTKLARSPERVLVSLPALETETETVVVIEQQTKTRISQALEKLDELLEFVL